MLASLGWILLKSRVGEGSEGRQFLLGSDPVEKGWRRNQNQKEWNRKGEKADPRALTSVSRWALSPRGPRGTVE